MARVEIFPGGTVERQANGEDAWSFRASVDGRAGVITIYFPGGTSESVAIEKTKALLERHPEELDGVVSTDPSDSDPDSSDDDSDDAEDNEGDDDEGSDDEDEDKGGDDDGDEEAASDDDEGDGVGERDGRLKKFAEAFANALHSGLLKIPQDDDERDGDGTGRSNEERLVKLIASVLASGKVDVPLDGLGEDVARFDPRRIAAIVSRALASGVFVPQPDDSSDGDGTGRPIPTFGPGNQ